MQYIHASNQFVVYPSEVAQLCMKLRNPMDWAPSSMAFSRQGYWSGLPFPYPGDFPNPEIEPRSPTLQADALPSEPPEKPNIPKTKVICKLYLNLKKRDLKFSLKMER